jgi:hypothetical protein
MVASSTLWAIRSDARSDRCTNAFMATPNAPRVWARGNFMRVMAKVPPNTMIMLGTSTKTAALPPMKMDTKMAAKAPIRPSSVARSMPYLLRVAFSLDFGIQPGGVPRQQRRGQNH